MGDDRIDRQVASLAEGIECLGLIDRARISIKQESVLFVLEVLEVALHHLIGHFIRYEQSFVHIALGHHPQLGLIADLAAEDVSGRDMAHVVLFHDFG